MSDKKQEENPDSSDNVGEISKSSNMEEKGETSRIDEESKCEERISKEGATGGGESLSETEIQNEKTSNVDSDVTMSEDSNTPMSGSPKETSEIVSESLHLMIKDIKNFFSNFKQLQSKMASAETSKRKLESAVEDFSEKSNLSHSEEYIRPTKKLHLDTSAAEAISNQQSERLTQNSKSKPAAAVSISSGNVGSLLPSISSVTIKCTQQEHSDTDDSTESRSSPEAGQSSEDSITTAEQPNAADRARNEDHLPNSQSEATNRAALPLPVEYFDESFVELNGIRSHRFPGTFEVQIIVPLFECFLNDLLDLKSFLEGQGSPPVPVEESAADASSAVAYSDRQLASIAVEFGTGVESDIAQITKDAVVEWDTKYISKVDSECLSGFSERSDFSEDNSLSGSSGHPADSESNSNESQSPTQSPDPTQSSSEADVVVLPTESSQSNLDTERSSTLEESSTTENPAQCMETETSPNEIPETTTNPPVSSRPTPTDSLRFHAELDHLNFPSEVSPLLRVLNEEGRKLVNSCILASKNFLRACLMNSSESFPGTLLEHMRGLLDTMRRLISIREECSDLLKKCPDKNSVAGIVYILKVKYYIAKVYNQLLEDYLAMNSNFHEVVKEKLPVDPVD